MDLPVWQALYEELGERGFLPIAVALETRGAEGARQWIENAKPAYPCLIDTAHRVAELYGMLNVPNAVWIDESGRVVRPAEPAGSTDGFREMDRTNFSLSDEARARIAGARRRYTDAIRDWVARGPASPYALPPEEVRRRTLPASAAESEAAAWFQVGRYLHGRGEAEWARDAFDEAIARNPESWAMRRQAWNLEDSMKSFGPEFWAAVDALGGRRYYPDVEL
jgi:hypothetical protein